MREVLLFSAVLLAGCGADARTAAPPPTASSTSDKLARVAPPASGEHEVQVRGTAPGLTVDVRYRLIVGTD